MGNGGVFPKPLPWFSECIKMAHKTQENILLTGLPVIIKGYNSGTARRERITGQGMGEGAHCSQAFSGHTNLPAPPWDRRHGSSPSPGRILMQASLCRHN